MRNILFKLWTLEVVRESALNTKHLISAVDGPFDEKDTLRGRGYRWRPDYKTVKCGGQFARTKQPRSNGFIQKSIAMRRTFQLRR